MIFYFKPCKVTDFSAIPLPYAEGGSEFCAAFLFEVEDGDE